MIYYINNPFSWEKEIFDTADYPNAQEICASKLAEYQQTYLEQEKIRFHFSKVTQVEGKEIWEYVNINNDPEEGDYRVFAQYKGTYDTFSNLSDAKTDVENKKQEFLTIIGLDKVYEVIQPVTEGTQTL
jgi:predicted transcriptional regulator